MTTEVVESKAQPDGGFAPDEYMSALEEVARASLTTDDIDFRANVPPGTELGRTNLGAPGADSIWKKRNSGVRIGDKYLPERIPLYNRQTGDVSMVPPTIATQRIMRQPTVFSLRKPADFPEKTPIEESCGECNYQRRAAGMPDKPFYSLHSLEAHKRLKHPNRFAADIRQEERDIRQRSDDRMLALIGALAQSLRGEEVDLPADIQEQVDVVKREMKTRGRKAAS